MLENKDIIQTIINFTDDDFSLSEIKQLDEDISTNISDDFYIELPNNGYEYRIINSDSIDRILEKSLEELVDECYTMPEGWLAYYITVDYETMARDIPYGEHFSSWDGSEESDDNYYYFRTN